MDNEFFRKVLLNFSPSLHRLLVVFTLPFIVSSTAAVSFIDAYVSANFLFILLSAGVGFYLLKNDDNNVLLSFFLISILGILASYNIIGADGAFFFSYFHYLQMVKSIYHNKKIRFVYNVLVDLFFIILLVAFIYNIVSVELIIFLASLPVITQIKFHNNSTKIITQNLKVILVYGVTGFLTASAPFLLIHSIKDGVSDKLLIYLAQCAIFLSAFLLVLRYFSISYLSDEGATNTKIDAFYAMQKKCIGFFILSLVILPFYTLFSIKIYALDLPQGELFVSILFYFSTALSILSFPFSMLSIKEGLENKNLKLNAIFFMFVIISLCLSYYVSVVFFVSIYTLICIFRAFFSLSLGRKYVHCSS